MFGDLLAVTFDQPLLAVPADPNNWAMRMSNTAYYADSTQIDGERADSEMIPFGPAPGPNGCDYAANPADIRALDFTPAAAFSGFPIT